MFQRLHELAEIIDQGEPTWQKLNEGMPENYTRGLAICFDSSGVFSGVKSWGRHGEVVYRSGPPNGHDLTACSKFGGEPRKTLKRLGRASETIEGLSEGTRKSWWSTVGDQLCAAEDGLVETVTSALEEAGTDQDNRPYLFVAELDGLKVSPSFEWPESHLSLTRGFLDSLGRTTKADAGTCQICGEKDREVFGNYNVLACYNLDKPGFIAGGFDKKNAVKNFPVCSECAVDLSQAIVYANDHLRGWAAGLSYLVIPSTSSGELREYLLEKTEEGYRRLRLEEGRDPLDDSERDLLDIASELAREDKAADLALHFLFFEQEKASWKLTAEVRQVSPSRMAQLQSSARALRRDPLLVGGSEKEPVPFRLTSQILADLSTTSFKRDQRQLRDWLVALLQGQALERGAFYHTVAGALIARSRKDPKYTESTARRAWAVVRYALMTGLIEREEGRMRPQTPASCYGAYCAEHPEFFTTDEHVAAFLSGCFANVVCAVQQKARGAKPFAKKFRGRLVDPTLLRRLYHEGRDRLEIYDGVGLARDLDADLAEALVAVGDDWKVSHDELTLAFTIGLALQYRVRQRAQQEKKEMTGDSAASEEEETP